MKKILLFLLILLVATSGYSQRRSSKRRAKAYTEGSSSIHLGVGFAPTYYGGGYLNSSLPLAASYEYGFSDRISGGAFVGYSSFNTNYYLNEYYYKLTYLTIAARANYHFFFIRDNHWDPYAGATLGYNSVSFTYNPYNGYYGPAYTYTGTAGSGLLLGLQAGTHYYFNKNVGAYAELGFGFSVFNLGVAFKF